MATEENVLVMQFPEPSQAFEALSDLKGIDGVRGAAVLERTTDGALRVADGYTPEEGSSVAVGGLVGGLVGVLAGPVGVLLGFTTGALIGGVYEDDIEEEADDGFTILSKNIARGDNALLVEIREGGHAPIDAIVEHLGGTVTRVPAADVDREVALAHDAEDTAKAAARKARHAQRRDEFKQKMSSIKPSKPSKPSKPHKPAKQAS